MSKFFLHGSGASIQSFSGISMLRKMADAAKDHLGNINLLVIGFGASRADVDGQDWEPIQRQIADEIWWNFQWANPHYGFLHNAASLDEVEFVKQLKWANVIYVVGGDGDLLQSRIPNIPLAKYVQKDKVIGGGSAGTNMWVDSYYSNDNQAVCKGLGVIPVKTFCHWNSYKCDALNELIKSGLDLPVYPLLDDGYVELEFA